LSKALKNKRNVEGKATQREIVKLRFEVFELRFDCGGKEKSFKILEKDFIESRIEVRTISKESNKVKETMVKKISELKASDDEKDKRVALLKAELKQAKKEYETETTRLRQVSVETTVNLRAAQVKIEDLNDEINQTRRLNENYRILMTNCYTLGNRCCNELMKTFSSTGAKSREKNFTGGDLEGMMRWVLSETRAYKSVLLV
jgi:predicted RNase H-like nuclease (RuvC/YqgF family)